MARAAMVLTAAAIHNSRGRDASLKLSFVVHVRGSSRIYHIDLAN